MNKIYALCAFCFVFILSWSGLALAQDMVTADQLEALKNDFAAQIAAQQEASNYIWVTVATALVFFMQGGFLLLEAGMVRSKNSINVAQKNIADFIFAGVFFYAIGFMFMFGETAGGWIGWDTSIFAWNESNPWHYEFFMFQLVFAGTAATIMSGAVAERMSFTAYILMVIVLSTVIYPIFGHWAWGNLFVAENTGHLLERGFIDFAGSTVVHSVGGWAALAGIILLGPRIGKFNEDGSANTINGHSYALATLGAIILWVGWIGFNGGSTTFASPDFAVIISNTVLSGCFGGFVSMIIGRLHEKMYRPDKSINGALGGLVGITAGCASVDTYGAIMIGMSSGVVAYLAAWVIENKWRLDDVIGAVPVHGFCGAWGTIALALLAPEANLVAESRMDQVLIQAQGVLFAFIWSFSVSFLCFWLIKNTIGLRVSEEHETLGLNSAEHGTTLGTGLLQERLKEIVFGDGDLTKRLDSTSGDESAEVAYLFNTFMDKIQKFIVNIKHNAQELYESSNSLSKVASGLSSSANTIEQQSKDVAGSTETVSEKMGSASGVVSGISKEIGTISDSATAMTAAMEDMSMAVNELSRSIADIAENADGTHKVVDETKAMAGNAADAVSSLTQASEHIGSVMTMIRDIAEKTNLLALNATIEAARAGEAGKGFAVVATEVKSLANQTAKATEEIEQRVKDIQDNTHGASDVIQSIVDMIETINSSVSIITDAAGNQRTAADDISSQVNESTENAGKMAQSIAQVNDGAKSISEDVSRAAEESKSLAGNITKFSSAAHESAENAEHVRKSAEKLSDVANRLDESVKQFKTE